jgi:hypothetical protein
MLVATCHQQGPPRSVHWGGARIAKKQQMLSKA